MNFRFVPSCTIKRNNPIDLEAAYSFLAKLASICLQDNNKLDFQLLLFSSKIWDLWRWKTVGPALLACVFSVGLQSFPVVEMKHVTATRIKNRPEKTFPGNSKIPEWQERSLQYQEEVGSDHMYINMAFHSLRKVESYVELYTIRGGGNFLPKSFCYDSTVGYSASNLCWTMSVYT